MIAPAPPEATPGLLVDLRGYAPLHRPGEVNHCPACHGTAWNLGRESAECAHCAAAVPYAHPHDGRIF